MEGGAPPVRRMEGPRSAVVVALSKKGGQLRLCDTGEELPFTVPSLAQLHTGEHLYAWIQNNSTVSRTAPPEQRNEETVFRSIGAETIRLGTVVRRLFSVSLKVAKELCKHQRVSLNQAAAEDSRLVHDGDSLALLPATECEAQPPPMQLVLCESDLAVLYKPAGESLDAAAVRRALGEGAFVLCRGVPKAMAGLVAVGLSHEAIEALKLPGGCRCLYVVVCDGKLTALEGMEWVTHSRSRKGLAGWISTAGIWGDGLGELLQRLCAAEHPVLGDANPHCRALGKQHQAAVRGKGKKLMAARVKLELTVGSRPPVVCEMAPPAKLASFTTREAKAWQDFADGKHSDKLFCGHSFETNGSTMRPKGSTEPLVQAVVGLAPATVCELGVGCGSLLISVLLLLPDATGVGVELDPAAAECARVNAAKHGLADRCEIVCADFSELHLRRWHAQFDVVVSNPPYHARDDKRVSHLLDSLSEEPAGAVFVPAGLDRVACYRAIHQSMQLCEPPLLAAGGHLVLEVGAGMVQEVETVLSPSMRVMQQLRDSRRTVRCLVLASDDDR